MKTTLYISGIHCQSCVSLISMDLDDLDGVEDISINADTGETTIQYDEHLVSLDTITGTICTSGDYTVVV